LIIQVELTPPGTELAASRRIAAALLEGDLVGKWTRIGSLVQDIETLSHESGASQ